MDSNKLNKNVSHYEDAHLSNIKLNSWKTEATPRLTKRESI